MFQIIIKGFIWYCTASLVFISCVSTANREKSKSFCPYDVNDHLEYWNYGIIVLTDDSKEESEAYNIYEVVSVEQTPEGTVVQFKNYYSDSTGVMEEYDIKFIYGENKVYLIRQNGNLDSLKFSLSDNQPSTLEDYIDSLGYHHRIKIEDNNASVQTKKGRLFEGCLKLVEIIYEPEKSPKDFVFQKISYYKDTILVKYTSINRMEADKGIKELRTESHLEGYNVFAWR